VRLDGHPVVKLGLEPVRVARQYQVAAGLHPLAQCGLALGEEPPVPRQQHEAGARGRHARQGLMMDDRHAEPAQQLLGGVDRVVERLALRGARPLLVHPFGVVYHRPAEGGQHQQGQQAYAHLPRHGRAPVAGNCASKLEHSSSSCSAGNSRWA
jgi:hypothetical protein